jgi:ketosteroid isomerase-like protein
MKTEERNVEILREAYRRWSDSKGQSIDHWLAILAEEIDFGSLAQGRVEAVAFTRPRQTREGVAQYLEGLTRDWEMLDYAVERFVAQGDDVVVLSRAIWRFRANAAVVDTPKADVWRFDAEGKAVSFFEYYDTAAMFAATSAPRTA